MRLRVEAISLEGTRRRVTFEPGLNIITGPMASGKTTLFRLVRSIFGGSLDNLPREARESISAIRGEIVVGETKYSVLRPQVTTGTARIEIASDAAGMRFPVSQIDRESNQTYLGWLLEQLKLPHLEVPSAPTRPESEPTPVSLNDYLLYCILPQDEIGYSVFGHINPFRNIKRKYVFEILYGIYNVETADIQEQLRDVQTRLRELKNQDRLFSQFLEDTALDNRAKIEHDLEDSKRELNNIENVTLTTQTRSQTTPDIRMLQERVLSLEEDCGRLSAEIESEKQAISNLDRLSSQLESQVGKITRSIVAEKYLSDIDFVICPRCGNHLVQDRSDADSCNLCFQPLTTITTRDSLIREQSRIEAQLSEARDLLTARQERLALLIKELANRRRDGDRMKTELNFQTKAFVSSSASELTDLAANRATLKSRVSQLAEYLDIYRKLDQSRKWAQELEDRKSVLEQQLESSLGDELAIRERIDHLDKQFNEILEKFHPPEFGEEKLSTVDRRTYLPLYRGRRFEDLSSPGLATLVTVAYAIAHQQTSIDLNLSLPNILMIDGLSEHLGEEGLDPQRLASVYDYLIEVSEKIGDLLQIIVVDNVVPPPARSFIRLELSDTDRLIPSHGVTPGQAQPGPGSD